MIFDKIDQWFLFQISNFIVSNFIPYFSYDLDSFVELHDLKLMGLRTFLILYDYIYNIHNLHNIYLLAIDIIFKAFGPALH